MGYKAFICGILFVLSSFISIQTTASSDYASEYTTEEFSFSASGASLNGIISRPKNIEATSTLIIVHGSGRTNVVEGDWFQKIRAEFTAKGISVFVWDKPGCGKSEGEFDINQPVESSADEVLAAISALKKTKEPGSDRVGLMGFSRAGWIAPLAVSREPGIKFWISVSGTNAFENWGYLLRSSLEIAGYAPAEINKLYQGWIDGNLAFNSGASYEEYLRVSHQFWKDELVQRLSGQQYVEHEPGSPEYEAARKSYLTNQKKFMAEGHDFDEQSGLEIHVANLDQVLKAVSSPVLAIFGQNDRQVDWRKTRKLYEHTMGAREPSKLTVKIFEGADHNLRLSKTGDFLETQSQDYWKSPYAEGYYEVMVNWVCANGFCSDTL